jgi:hypothetical protein
VTIVHEPFKRFSMPAHANCQCGEIMESAELVIVKMRSGGEQYRLRCHECMTVPFYNIPKSKLTGEEMLGSVLFRDNADMILCARCGSSGGEDHHTAPWAAFGLDSETWPIIRLCVRCHAEWHATMDAYYRGRFGR